VQEAVGFYSSSGVDNIWTFDQEEAFLKYAPAHLHLRGCAIITI